MVKLLALDASGFLYRSYHAIQAMTDEQGRSTHALFGFARSLLKILDEQKPTHCVAVFDGLNNSASRTKLDPLYKAHRASMPSDLKPQIEWAQQLCQKLGISLLSVEGVEADDTLATITQWASSEGASVLLCTNDKDLYQLVSATTQILDAQGLYIGPEQVLTKFGVPPEKMADYLSLVGDSSDNIPGVKGIGAKSAAHLLQTYGSLQELLDHPENISNARVRALLEQQRAQALLSAQLVQLDYTVPFPKEWSFFTRAPIDQESLRLFLAQFQFHSLVRELKLHVPQRASHYEIINTQEALDQCLAILSQEPLVVIDTETTALHPLDAQLVGIGLAIRPHHAWYIPFNGELSKEALISTLRPFFNSHKVGFCGHNLKYDYHILYHAGMPVRTLAFDTLLASYLLNSHSRRHNLDELSMEYFGITKTPIESLLGKGRSQITMDQVPIDKVAGYCGEDVDYTLQLKQLLEPQLVQRQLMPLYQQIELPLLPLLAQMEREGIFVDQQELKKCGKELGEWLSAQAEKIYQEAGGPLNLNSPKQVSELLFEKLKIPAPKGKSTGAEVLDALKAQFPIAGWIQEYRALDKLRSTYVEGLLEQVNPTTGRIHCTFNQSVTATGRLSCQDPNLQNIPVRTAAGAKIRHAFRPEEPEWSLLSADYSQIELRLLAHLSEDPVMVQAFLQGDDIHASTAATIFHLPLEAVTKEQRSRAKAVNFGILYGQGPYGLAQQLAISPQEAAQFIENYFHQYPRVRQCLEAYKDQARKTGKTTTFTGRERLLPEIHSSNMQLRNAAERLAVNTPFQGAAADLIKMAMLAVDRALKREALQSKMLLQIHDELLFEAPDTELSQLSAIVKKEMEGVITLKIPLIVDVSIGKNWQEC